MLFSSLTSVRTVRSLHGFLKPAHSLICSFILFSKEFIDTKMLSLRLSALGLLALGASAQNSIAPIVSDKTYDYIIAGGGPAGIIAAERIAEAGYSVLLLERGPVSTYSSGNTEETLSWNDTITPFDVPGFGWWLSEFPASLDKYCSDVDGYTGCLLGGGSSVNALLFMKPPARDFDDKWPAGWKWEDVSSAADRLYCKLSPIVKISGS